ncbi:MAG: KpsF/GutQ family sugar-phosphate isomerase [Verrucomicrobia bacterium]|nr:MAG: KpsF/GutQ family sugar-phosphate isomerase [Verrucomicrobiota bacterium]
MTKKSSRAYLDRAREVFDIEIEALERVRDRLGEEFSRAVNLMLEALSRGGKIIITGIGKNLPVGQKIAATLTSTGAPAVFLHPLEAMHGDLGIVADGDVVLALSYTGETEELATLLPILKRSGAHIIAVTGNPGSTLASHSDLVLNVRVDREACPFNMAPTASTTATLALCDALAMVLLEARGFRKEDYALLHPGGAIGRTLLLRAADIMRTGDRLACVKVGTTVKEAILAMTSARAGSVAVTDKEGKLLGIFTDGDLRRHLTDNSNLTERRIEEVMTPDPVAVSRDALAVEVLSVYETHDIDDLIVVDGDNRVVGMIDIQDLPKFKIL